MRDNTSPALDIDTVDAARWADFERLFEGRGGPKNCWCMIYRATPEEARQRDKASRKAAMERRISAGVPVGLLAYQGGEPVAWCSIAPRATCRLLQEAAVEPPPAPGLVWSLACFYVVRRLRGQGIARRLIAAAVEHARAGGARVVEAYPVDADSPSYRFGGFVETFAAAGFQEVGRLGTRRHVMWLELG
ncbi:MAG TPA: GNAT family N-acetyltransferase [bacterium]|nr:GNAT family N-acetyltransferase [bacterium]